MRRQDRWRLTHVHQKRARGLCGEVGCHRPAWVAPDGRERYYCKAHQIWHAERMQQVRKRKKAA